VVEWQGAVREGDTEAVDLAEFIGSLRRAVLDLERDNALGERREAALREQLEQQATAPPTEAMTPSVPRLTIWARPWRRSTLKTRACAPPLTRRSAGCWYGIPRGSRPTSGGGLPTGIPRAAPRRARRGRGARLDLRPLWSRSPAIPTPRYAASCIGSSAPPTKTLNARKPASCSELHSGNRYKRSHFAKLLGLTDKQLAAADKLPELKALGGGPASYQPRHLSAYRRVLDRHPRREPSRRQLFLNFKGGTGRQPLGAYAYRLAELGHRVLLIDLDSQGHATQHLGLAAESLERTVFDTLVGGVPIADVIVRTPLAEFDVLPANLRMTTIDISLMPMAGREYKLQRALAGCWTATVRCHGRPALLWAAEPQRADGVRRPARAGAPRFPVVSRSQIAVRDAGPARGRPEPPAAADPDCSHQYNPTTRIAREAKAALESHYREFLSETIVRQCTQFARASSDGLPSMPTPRRPREPGTSTLLSPR